MIDDEKTLMVGLAVSIQYTNVTDRRTRTDTGQQQRPRYAYASRGNMTDRKVFKLGIWYDLGIF